MAVSLVVLYVVVVVEWSGGVDTSFGGLFSLGTFIYSRGSRVRSPGGEVDCLAAAQLLALGLYFLALTMLNAFTSEKIELARRRSKRIGACVG